MVDILARMIAIRNYRNLTLEDVASWFGIKYQSWAKKEHGMIAGFSPADFEVSLTKPRLMPGGYSVNWIVL